MINISKSGLAGKKIAAIVANSCKADARVIKEAESLVNQGAKVTVFCLDEENLPKEELINGVIYKRFPRKWINESSKLLSARLRCFLNRKERTLYSIGLTFIYLVLALFLFLINSIITIWCFLNNLIGFNRRLNEPGKKQENYKERFFKALSGYPFVRIIFVFVKYDIYIQTWYDALIAYEPDIIHAHDFETVPVAVHAAKKIKAQVIYDAHEIDADREGANKGKLQVAIIDRTIHNYISHINGLITTNPSSMAFHCKRYGIKDVPTCVIYNAPSYQENPVNKNSVIDIKTRLNLKNSDQLVVYTGAIGINRGVEEIAVALKSLDIHFCIIGPQKESVQEDFLKYIHKLNIEERVHLLPPVPYSDIVSTISTADMGICFTKPSCLNHLYSTPNKLFEMLIAGLPIICPDLPEMGRIIREENVGITVEPGNIEALTQAIRHLRDNMDTYRPNSEEIERIRQKWSWEAQEIKLIEFYTNLVSSGHSDHPI